MGYVLSNMLIGNTAYNTPNLIGLTLHEAIIQTSPFHINIQLADQKECPGITQGTIMSQKPTAGRLIKPHQSITVITSKLPETEIAPNLLGLNQSQIQDRCNQQNLKCKIYTLAHQLPTGSCIGQKPQAGQPISDKKITVYLAKHDSKMNLMPSLTEKPLEQVIEFLKKYPTIQVQVAHENQKLFPPYPQDLTVTAQKPLAASFVNLQNHFLVYLEVK